MSDTLRVVSYNIHAGRGPDGRRDIGRILAVLAEIDADVVGVQEVDTFSEPHGDQFAALTRGTGFHAVAGPAVQHAWRRYGNAVLARRPIVAGGRTDLSVPHCEPRGAVHGDIDLGGRLLRAIVTHFGLRVRERWQQVRFLKDIVDYEPDLPVLVMGDFNAWGPERLALHRMGAGFWRTAPATFPSWLPVLALDRLWTRPAGLLRRVWTHRSLRARRASDHLPLVAEVALDRLTGTEAPHV